MTRLAWITLSCLLFYSLLGIGVLWLNREWVNAQPEVWQTIIGAAPVWVGIIAAAITGDRIEARLFWRDFRRAYPDA